MTGRLLVALAFLVVAGIFEFGTTAGIPGADDGYRHVKLAHRYATEGTAALGDPFRLVGFWPMPMDGWFGYHLLLAPFTALLPLIAAAKLVVMLEFAALALVLWLILEDAGVAWKPAWVALAIFGSSMVFYRAMYARPFLLSLILLLWAARFALKGQWIGVAVVSALHAFCYSIVFLVGLPVGLVWLLRRDRRSLVALLASIGGIAVGVLLNPFFPENVRFIMVQTLGPLTTGVQHDLDIGGELKPVSIWWLAGSLPVAIVFGAALAAAWRRRSVEPVLFLALAVITLVGSLRVARFFDYFVMAAVLFAAVALDPWLRRHRKDAPYVAGLLFVLCAANLFLAWKTLAATPDPQRFRAVGQFLEKQAPDALVVNAHWGDYYFLYFWNARSRYLIGIDPTFYYLMNRSGYWFWRHASNDEPVTCGQPVCGASSGPPSRWLADSPAQFVVLDRKKNPRLNEDLRGSARFREVFHDAEMSVFGRQ